MHLVFTEDVPLVEFMYMYLVFTEDISLAEFFPTEKNKLKKER